MTLSTNAGEMFTAIGASSVSRATTLFSGTQSFTRVFGGWSCDALRQRSWQRTWILTVALIIMSVGYLCLIVNDEEWLSIGIVICGAGFGFVWPTMVVLVSERFGTANLGSNYMIFDGGTSAFGSLIFSKLIPSWFYNAHISSDDDETDCVGDGCFRGLFIVVLCSCMVALLASLRLTMKFQHKKGE